MRATAPGGGAVMHVTSHISNSLVSFSAHEMPIWSGFEADLHADVCVKPRAATDFAAAMLTPPATVAADRWRTEVRRYKGNGTSLTRLRVFPLSLFYFRFSNFRHFEVKNENLQH
ncbi:MAG: hypothetical protein WA673_04820 [Candidatus Acidiferrales bacterium]